MIIILDLYIQVTWKPDNMYVKGDKKTKIMNKLIKLPWIYAVNNNNNITNNTNFGI